VTPPPTAARNVERAQAGHDFVPRLRTGNVGVARKLADRAYQRISIHPRLPRAEILARPLDYVSKVELSDGAEANIPPLLGHARSFAGASNDLFREIVQIRSQLVGGGEFLELAAIQRVEAGACRFPQ
jgi:hypothetical protein